MCGYPFKQMKRLLGCGSRHQGAEMDQATNFLILLPKNAGVKDLCFDHKSDAASDPG